MKFILMAIVITSYLPSFSVREEECQAGKDDRWKHYSGCGIEEPQKEQKSYGLKLS